MWLETWEELTPKELEQVDNGTIKLEMINHAVVIADFETVQKEEGKKRNFWAIMNSWG